MGGQAVHRSRRTSAVLLTHALLTTTMGIVAPKEFDYRTATTLGRGAMRALGVRVETRGVDHIPTDGPVIIASTHVSYGDALPIALAARGRGRFPRFLARHDVWHPPALRAPMTRMQHIPVDRAAPAGAYLHARRLLREGQSLGIFPEAGISYSFTVRPLMRGTAALARETGAVVIPAALWGIQRIYSVGRPEGGVLGGKESAPDWTRGRCVDMVFGQPLTIGPGEDLADWTIKLGIRLTELLEGLQTLPHHRPRPGEYAPWYPTHLGGHAPCRVEAAPWDNIPRSAVPVSWGPLPAAASGRQRDACCIEWADAATAASGVIT